MPVTYEPANAQVRRQVDHVIQEHRRDLLAGDVRVLVLMAYGPLDKDGRTTGPALKHHGYQAAATIQKLALKWRVVCNHDALMLLDGDRFEEWPEATQLALIDHELMHLEVQWEGVPASAENGYVGTPLRDDAMRPKLAIRLHDWQVTGFEAVAQRWGRDAFDTLIARKFKRDFGETLFDGVDELDDAAAPAPAARPGADGVGRVTITDGNGELLAEYDSIEAMHQATRKATGRDDDGPGLRMVGGAS